MASKNGQLTFNFALLVPAENTAAVEEIIAAHAAWMKETHSLEAGSGIHLVDYHVAKGEEANDLLDPSKGCLLYTSPSPRDLSTSRMPSSA